MPSIHLKTEIPGPRSQKLNELRHEHVSPGPFHTTPVIASHAEGSVVTDVDGNSFLDFSSAIARTSSYCLKVVIANPPMAVLIKSK